MIEELPFCECGCGGRVSKGRNQFIHGHNRRGVLLPPETCARMSAAKTGVPRSPEACVAMSRSASRKRNPLPNGWEIKEDSKMATNKECGSYLGIVIAEQLLAKIYPNVQVMPPKNRGYDFICGNGYKIDVKSAATGNKGYWLFNITQNKIADFFLLIAFGNREDLNPVHLWLIPGRDINHLQTTQISKSNLNRWAKYEQSLDKVLACCNEMR